MSGQTKPKKEVVPSEDLKKKIIEQWHDIDFPGSLAT